MNNDDLDAFLAHHGIKGQRWGIRNKKNQSPLTAAQRRKKKIRRDVGIAALKGGAKGAIFTAALLATFYPLMVGMGSGPSNLGGGRIPRPSPARAKSVADLIEKERNTQMYSLRRTLKEGHLDKEQFTNFKKILNARYDRRLADL